MLCRIWHMGDIVKLNLAMPVRVTEPHPFIDTVRGCLALERGPLVYCFERIDHPHLNLKSLQLNPDAPVKIVPWPDRLGGIVALRTRGRYFAADDWFSRLYVTRGSLRVRSDEVDLLAIPYFAWANRDMGQMRVWLPKLEA